METSCFIKATSAGPPFPMVVRRATAHSSMLARGCEAYCQLHRLSSCSRSLDVIPAHVEQEKTPISPTYNLFCHRRQRGCLARQAFPRVSYIAWSNRQHHRSNDRGTPSRVQGYQVSIAN